MNATIAQGGITAAAVGQILTSLEVAHRVDEDVVATEGNWFFEVDVTRDLVVFACLFVSQGEASLSIDVRSRRDECDPVLSLGHIIHDGMLPGATIAALIRGSAALAREGRRIG